MAESLVQVTEGSGKKLHSWQRTIGANNVEDEFTLPGEYPLATYTMVVSAVSFATANDHILQLMAGASLNVRIRRWQIIQRGAGTAAVAAVGVIRLTSAGTGGTAITARPLDSADSAAGSTGLAITTVKGTEGVELDRQPFWVVTTGRNNPMASWQQSPNGKPITIPAGTANGLCWKVLSSNASLTVDLIVEFVETSFL